VSYDATGQSFTAAELLERVRTRAILLSTTTDWTDTKLLREVSDSVHSFITWAMSVSAGGRLVETYNRSINAALASSYRAGSEYELPPLCVADTIEAVTWISQDGIFERRLDLITEAAQSIYDSPDAMGDPLFYALLSGRIRVYPQPVNGGILRFSYQRRHPELIADTPENVGTVLTASDQLDGYVLFTLAAASPLLANTFADLVSDKYPYRPLFTSLYCDSSAQCRLYLPYAYLSSVNLTGMRVMRSGQSPYLHLPLEFRAALIEHASAKVMRTIGDFTGAQACDAVARAELGQVIDMLAPRVKQQRPVARNPNSLMRRGLRRF
jgi:hypothetical protein